MRVQTFMGKVSTEALHQLDEHVNRWMEAERIVPKKVSQCFGYDKAKDGGAQEPVVIISVWY